MACKFYFVLYTEVKNSWWIGPYFTPAFRCICEERASICNNIRGWSDTYHFANCICTMGVLTLTRWAGQSGRDSSRIKCFFGNKSSTCCLCRFCSCLDTTLAVGGRRWRICLGWMQRHAGTAGDACRPRRVSFKATQILLRFVASCAEFDGAPSEIRPTRTDGAHRLGLA